MVAENCDSPEGAFLREQIIDIVENLYDIGKVTAVNEIFGGYSNRSFGVETLKAGCEKTYFVRQYKYSVTAEEIRFEHALISHAINNGFTIVAGVVENTHEETFVYPINGGGMFAIFEYLEGEDTYAWDNHDLTDNEFECAGRVLAAFHNAVCDFNADGRKRMEPPILKLWTQFADKLKKLAKQKQSGKLYAYYKAHIQSILAMIARNPLDPNEVAGMPVIPIHCDYHPGNLKWVGEQIVGIFDFDWSKIDLRLFDIGMAVIYFCSRWGEGRDGELRTNKCELFLGAYQHELQKLARLVPLTPDELDLLPKMLGIANIYQLYWGLSNFQELEESHDEEYLTYLKHSHRVMHWLETHQAVVDKTIARVLP